MWRSSLRCAMTAFGEVDFSSDSTNKPWLELVVFKIQNIDSLYVISDWSSDIGSISDQRLHIHSAEYWRIRLLIPKLFVSTYPRCRHHLHRSVMKWRSKHLLDYGRMAIYLYKNQGVTIPAFWNGIARVRYTFLTISMFAPAGQFSNLHICRVSSRGREGQ